MAEQFRSRLDHAKAYINYMKYEVEVCNGKFLADYTANAAYVIKDAFYDKEIDRNKMIELQKQVSEIIDSFDKNCTCRGRLIKKK